MYRIIMILCLIGIIGCSSTHCYDYDYKHKQYRYKHGEKVDVSKATKDYKAWSDN